MACTLEQINAMVPAFEAAVAMAEVSVLRAVFPFQRQDALSKLSSAKAGLADIKSRVASLSDAQNWDDRNFWGDLDKVIWMNEQGLECKPANW